MFPFQGTGGPSQGSGDAGRPPRQTQPRRQASHGLYQKGVQCQSPGQYVQIIM